MSGSDYTIGYGKGEIEPKIAPLVDAVRRAGFVTFSSCEGHIDAPAYTGGFCTFTSIAFYAHEDEAKHVHEAFLSYRDRLACSWVFRGGFVLPKGANEFILGWTLENCGIMESVERGGRLGLNSVSVPIDGFPTDPFHRLPLRGVA